MYGGEPGFHKVALHFKSMADEFAMPSGFKYHPFLIYESLLGSYLFSIVLGGLSYLVYGHVSVPDGLEGRNHVFLLPVDLLEQGVEASKSTTSSL